MKFLTLFIAGLAAFAGHAQAVGITDPRGLTVAPQVLASPSGVSASSEVSFGQLSPSAGAADGHNSGKTFRDPREIDHASLTVGPVPAHAGEALHLRLPAAVEHIDWVIYTADMKVAGRAEGRAQSSVDFTQTADLATGVYVARLVMDNNGLRRESIQKIIITR